MRKRSIVISLGLATSLVAAVSCENRDAATKADAATQPIAVTLEPVSHAPIPATVDFVGTLYGDEEAQVASKVPGRIVTIAADLGDRVDDGQVLAAVDPTDYQLGVQQADLTLREALSKLGLDALPAKDFDLTTIATVRRASVQAENAKARLDRSKQLFEQTPPLISPQEYADTQTQYEVAKQDYDVSLLEVKNTLATAQSRAAELTVARQQLADTQIRAPISAATTQPSPGRWAIAERRTNIGEYVQAGTVVFRVLTDQPIKLRTSLPERFVGRIIKDQPVSLYVDSLATATQGAVSRVSPAVDATSRTFAVEVTFANTDRKLQPGAFGRGTITIGTRNDVTTIPAGALYSFAGLNKVFTVKDGKVATNIVNVVSHDDKHVVVEGNLGGASDAIVGGLTHLATGFPVTTKKAE